MPPDADLPSGPDVRDSRHHVQPYHLHVPARPLFHRQRLRFGHGVPRGYLPNLFDSGIASLRQRRGLVPAPHRPDVHDDDRTERVRA